VIGTAGHIDHGKTALIRALTGVDTDRLPEEKRRGITVDLGFASLNLEAPGRSPLLLSFIDVPGHALFVRNMLAGAGGIDAVMLVISAEEGVKPQTEEHLAICAMLGIELGLTVLTKSDAVSEQRAEEVRDAVRQFLSNTFLDTSRMPLVAVSARTGAGMENLRRELVSLATRIPERSSDALPRLPLDRAFVMKGFGTVVTGTLIAGTLKIGQMIGIEPDARAARIRGIQVHGRAAEAAYAGSRVALNLAGVDASELRRGDTLVEPSSLTAADAIDVEVNLLSHASALKHRSRVHFHAFAAECMATVSLYGYQPVEPGSTRLMRLRLGKPIVLLPGDRFVIRQSSPAMTIGGGRVLDAHPMPRLRKAKCQAWLENLGTAPFGQQMVLRVARRGVSGIRAGDLSLETGLKVDALSQSLQPLIRDGRLIQISSDLLLTPEALDAAMSLVVRAFESKSKARGAEGIKRSELRGQARLGDEVFNMLLDKLAGEKKLRLQGELVLPFHLASQSADGRGRLSAIDAAYESAGLAAPSPEELSAKLGIEPVEMRKFVTSLLREKTLMRLGSDALFVHQRPLAELRLKMQALRGQTIDVTRFKQLTGLSRKYAIPLLEYLDRERITRKQGDHRIVL